MRRLRYLRQTAQRGVQLAGRQPPSRSAVDSRGSAKPPENRTANGSADAPTDTNHVEQSIDRSITGRLIMPIVNVRYKLATSDTLFLAARSLYCSIQQLRTAFFLPAAYPTGNWP